MSSDRFHKAARDGLLEVLKDITKRETNNKDVDGMTPVLWAAFEGKLEILRFLVGRGGDPNKTDRFGNTALHFAASKGHIHCVDFLVKFGVNVYSLDIDRHTAKDLAAINNREEILRYLDLVLTKLESTDRKKAKNLKEAAEKTCDKRIKEFSKRQQKLEHNLAENIKQVQQKTSVLSTLRHKIWSSSQGNLKQACKNQPNLNSTKYSILVSGNNLSNNKMGTIQKRTNILKTRSQANNLQNLETSEEDKFIVDENDSNGKHSIRSLQEIQCDSEMFNVGSFNSNNDNGKRGKLVDVFDCETISDTEKDTIRDNYGTISRSKSQPDFLAIINNNDDSMIDEKLQQTKNIFNRPMIGSLAFRRSVTAALSNLQPEIVSIDSTQSRKNLTHSKQRINKSRTFHNISDSESGGAGSDDSDDDQQQNKAPIQRFLAAWGLEEHLHIFEKQQIDLDTLMLLTESDLKSLGLPLGPFRKLVVAIQERRSAFTNPGVIIDSRL